MPMWHFSTSQMLIFADKNIILIMSKNMGWPVSGPKPTKMGIEDWDPDATGPPSSNQGFPGPKRANKRNGVGWGWVPY